MTTPVGTLFRGAPMALHAGLAGHLLRLDLPTAWHDDDDDGPRRANYERFTVARGVAVVPINGLLTFNNPMLEYYFGWATYTGICASMAELAVNTEVAAVVAEINSPGGYVTGLEAAARAMADTARVKPVHVLVNPLAASAAYWLAASGSDITMTPGSLVGSIGVALTTSAPVQPDNWGDQWFAMTSSNARAKWPNPTTEEGRVELQRGLDEAELRFHAAVAAGRRIAPDGLKAALSVTEDPRDGGAVFESDQAIPRGLADAAQTRNEFYARIFGQYAPKPRTATPRSARAHAAQAAAAAAQAAI